MGNRVLSAAPTFSQRLERRQALWWARRPLTDWRTYPLALHRLHEWYAERTRDDVEPIWRCCALWQRTLVNKWNAREFAIRHGCPVPELYWAGSRLADAPLASFPSHFVVRAATGAARRGVIVVAEGRDLLRNVPASQVVLRRWVPQYGRLPRRRHVLVEEFVRSEDGEYSLPLEYKCHTFGGAVAAIQVVSRKPGEAARLRYYTPAWEPFADLMDLVTGQDHIREPPRCLPQILTLAARLGTAFETYVRVDFFATDGGCVFNEFSSVPNAGRFFTRYADDLFGARWEETFPTTT